jgi:hypothetical protein
MRPDSTSFALFVHVAGAMVLVGGLLTAAAATLIGWRDDAIALRRFSYRTLLAVALPGYIVMRIGAQWVQSDEYPDSYDPTWLGIGYITADGGAVLLLIALILGGIGLRKSQNGGGTGLLKASGAIATLLVAVYVITIWAMGAKPS